MKKMLLGFMLLLGVTFGSATPANAGVIVVPVYPVRPVCYYRVVPVVQYVVVYTVYGPVYQAVTTYVYQLVCR